MANELKYKHRSKMLVKRFLQIFFREVGFLLEMAIAFRG